MIKSIVNASIQYRTIVILIVLLVALFGIYSVKHLSIDAVPDITNNQVQINTTALALSPVEMERQVTFPIEMALGGIPGLEGTRSLSRNGFSQVTAVFEDHVNIYFARQQITERLREVKELLPDGIEPTMGPLSTGLGEVLMWTVDFKKPIVFGTPGWQKDGSYITPDGERLKTEVEFGAFLRTLQDYVIRPQMSGIKGLAGVDSIGGYVKELHIQPDPAKLAAFGISFDEIIQAVARNNLNIGAGSIEKGGEAFLVKADGRVSSQEEIESILVANRKGHPIFIRDIAVVGVGKEIRSGSASENGHEVVIGTAMMLIGSNSRDVAKGVDERLAEINKSLPPGVEARVVLNRMKLVDGTIHTVLRNLTEGALLVVAVLFLFLRNFAAACLTALVIPLSMLLTAIGMVDSHISGNLMSLGAIDFGLIVDGAVIIVENCLSRLHGLRKQLGRPLVLEERLAEVKEATAEMIRPSVFGQAIIMIVYLPLLTLSGVEGKMFHPMAATVLFALFSAFVLSLTFVPAMVALFVKGASEESEANWIEWLKKGYAKLLNFSLSFPKEVVAASCLVVICSFFLFNTLGQEFVPSLDEHDLAIQATRIPSTSLMQATAMQHKVETTLKQFPQVKEVFSKTGTAEMASDPMPPDASDTFVILKPFNEWPNPSMDKETLIEEMEEALTELTGNKFEFTQPIQMRFNELIAGVKSDVAVIVFGDDFEKLLTTANAIGSSLKKVEGAKDVIVEPLDGLSVYEFEPKRESLQRHGLNLSEVYDLIATAIGGKKAGDFREGDRRFDIVLRLDDSKRQDLALLETLPVPAGEKEGEPLFLPLREFGILNLKEGINQVSRENGKRRIVVQSNVRGRDLGSFVGEAKLQIEKDVTVPPGYWIRWGGEFEHLLSSQQRLQLVVPLCFFLIFILLYSALHSFKMAVLVFTGVPLAMTGGVIALWFREIPFSISSAVGFIALSGIAVLNGLVLTTTIREKIETGIEIERAIREGALRRFRPVLITATVASLGFLPMAFGVGAGAEVQKPLATVVIGGLVSSTLLTLALLPSLFKIFWGSKNNFSKKDCS